jgi:ribosomal-protein-serine acetyltransferase
MQPQTIKVTDDIELRHWKTKDAPALFALTDKNREILQPWLPWVPETKTAADSKKFILNCIKEYKEETAMEMGIWYKGELVGCAGLHHIGKTSRQVAIGYWLSAEHHGRGIITQGVRALVKYAFKTLDLNRVEILAGTTNTRSWAVAERLGFVMEGIKRQAEFVDNKYIDYVMYSMLRSEWVED